MKQELSGEEPLCSWEGLDSGARVAERCVVDIPQELSDLVWLFLPFVCLYEYPFSQVITTGTIAK